MATFVLVHGAFHGAWCFVHVVPALAARGHRAIAIDLPGQGDDPAPAAACSLAGNAARIADAVASAGEGVVLVGHSLGGMSIAAAAELRTEGIRRLAFVTAFLPVDGDTAGALDALPEAERPPGPSLVAFAEDRQSYSARAEVAAERFYNASPAADVAFALARLRPQAVAVPRTPVRLSPGRFGRIPRAYVECLDDRVIPLALQRAMVARSPCDPVITLAADHSPFFSAPDALAAALDGLAGD